MRLGLLIVDFSKFILVGIELFVLLFQNISGSDRDSGAGVVVYMVVVAAVNTQAMFFFDGGGLYGGGGVVAAQGRSAGKKEQLVRE